jgi:hypothetical protein
MATAILSRVMVLSACVGLLAGAHSAQAGESMPPGAFLHQPAPDVATLNRQIAKDPLVAERYARLYNMSPEMVRSAFSKMHLSTLAEDHIYEVHYVHPGERIGYKVRRVRKGTAIYRMPDGTPALVRVCGNPIRATQPKAVRGAFRRAPELGQPESALDFQPYEPLEASVTPSPVPAEGLREGEFSSEFVESPGLEAPIEMPVGLGPVAAAATAVHTVSAFANAVPILGALGALGGLGALAAGSGGGTPGGIVPIVPPITNPGGGPPVIVVPPTTGGGGGVGPAAPSTTPEPNAVFLALALLSSGGVSLVRHRRKAKRS